MQIGVSSYSYSRLVKAGTISQIEVVAKAKEMGFDALEFSTVLVPEGKTLEAFAHELREESEKVGIPLVNYTIGANFLNGSNKDLKAEIARVKKEVDIAKILGVPGMRHDATAGFDKGDPRGKGFADALPYLVEGCRAVTEYASELGIKTMVENHGFFSQDSLRLEQLVSEVNHPNFGILIDMGNFVCADDSPGIAVGRLLPFAFHVHAKDFHLKPGSDPWPGEGYAISRGGNYWRGAIIGHGNVPIVQCLNAMKRFGYDGVLSIEYEGMEDVIRGIQIGQVNLRQYVKQVFGE